MADQEIKPLVFISYSRKDINFARRLAADLEDSGFNVWWDISDLKGGDDWVRFIPTAIQDSQYFVVLLSPNSIESEWVAKEYSYALRLHKKVIPAMIKTCDVPFALNTINYVDFVQDDYETALNKLLLALDGAVRPEMPLTGWKKLSKSLPPVITRNPFWSVGIVIILLAIVLFSFLRPTSPVPPPATDSPTVTSTITPSPTLPDPDTDTPTPSPTQTFTPTISATPSLTPTRTAIPPNVVPPTVCVHPTEFDVHSIFVRTGPGTDRGVLPNAPVIEVGKCPVIGGQNENETWLMIAYGQTTPEFIPYQGGWIRKDLFDLSTMVIIPVITLTPTPTITLTPTITPTFTTTSSPTSTVTFTSTSTQTFTPTPTETSTPTYTPFPTNEPDATVTP